jgi:hypothetical protein
MRGKGNTAKSRAALTANQLDTCFIEAVNRGLNLELSLNTHGDHVIVSGVISQALQQLIQEGKHRLHVVETRAINTSYAVHWIVGKSKGK